MSLQPVEQHTVRDFTEKAFLANGIRIRWEGVGLEEKGYDVGKPEKCMVCVNPQWFRPTDVDQPLGRPYKGPDSAWLESPEDKL